MPFEFKLAWKYFCSARKGLVRFTAAVAVIGIAAGVASLIVAQGLVNGFADQIRSKILSNTAHISVTEKSGAGVSKWEFVENKIAAIKGVNRVSPVIYESAVISAEDASSYGVLRVEIRKPVPGKTARNGEIEISLGKELAARLGLKRGDLANLISFRKGKTPFTSEVKIAGIFETGLYEYDSVWISAGETEYRKLTNSADAKPTTFGVFVDDIFTTAKTSNLLRDALGSNFDVLDWREANQPLFAALSLERKVTVSIISLIIFIAALNITTTLALLINERRLDIAVLRTCGAKTRNLIAIFLLEGIILSLAGIAAGTALGLSTCFFGNYFKIVRLDKEVYSLSHVPFHPAASDLILIVSIALMLCIGATLYPALRVTKIKPLENLRTQ